MLLYTKVNGTLRKKSEMALAAKSGLMAHFMKVSGKMIRLTGEADLFMLMVMFMMGSGLMIKLMASENTSTMTKHTMRVNGKMISNMAEARNIGQMVLTFMGTIETERKKEKVLSTGAMARSTKEISKKIKSPESVLTPGPTRELIAESGLTTKCKAQAPSNGQMAVNILENIL